MHTGIIMFTTDWRWILFECRE